MSQVIFNSETARAETWYPQGYIVDGQPGTVTLPRYALDVIREDAPPYDPATQDRAQKITADIESNTYNLGWHIRALTPEEIEDRKPKPGPVTPRQFWLALYASAGITKPAVEALLADNIPALIEIRESLEIDPAHPLISQLAAHPAIDKSPEEIAALFLHAATL
jgi:hypothetical protein